MYTIKYLKIVFTLRTLSAPMINDCVLFVNCQHNKHKLSSKYHDHLYSLHLRILEQYSMPAPAFVFIGSRALSRLSLKLMTDRKFNVKFLCENDGSSRAMDQLTALTSYNNHRKCNLINESKLTAYRLYFMLY